MHKNYLRPTLALVGGFGLLAACPPGTGTTTETDTDNTGTETSTTEAPDTTQAPTSEPPTTTTTTTTGPTTTEGPTTDTTTTTTTTTGEADGPLCVALGGKDGVAELVTAAVGGVLLDDKINAYFLNSDVDGGNLSTCLNKQLGALAECGGVVYDCQDMKAAHTGLGISALDFADFAADFSTALDAHQANHPELGDADKDTILSALTDMESDIVEDAESNLTVYQRVGRKPAIRTLIGASGEVGSFLDNVALDPAINGFFGAADYARLNTCLTRQVGGIDGPSKYGLEVDAPAPADPGVGAGNPCKTMLESHEGLLDSNDNTGIDITDFGALVGDLVTAMNTAMVAQPDQDAILAALGAMCEDIVVLESKNDCPTAQKLEVVEATAIGGMVIDEIYDGTFDTMYCHDLEVPDDPINFVRDIQVTLGINHNWVGDVTVKLVSPEDKILTLVSRPGLVDMNDDGSGCCGDSANLSKDFPITFKDGAGNTAEDLGKVLANTNQIICKDDNIDPCEWSPNPGSGPGMNFGDFFGDTATGTWRLCVADSNINDAGVVDSIKLSINRVKYDPMP
ncbi:proprotein convertase P-domain-containing protein [Nannocystis punicea]|uniref:Proprotein convertase P-domain-containing protein n=1 Tax=Nannocystis punicea TaxID=2995304 RepID=A0ABY7HED0_9BACT|nr:proprotein convertase P-domain-containing protein [Nannocystis poenicansa]WAS97329.1 proprotein convertase P-domain-containing protein [Nannocystis poenicansa]